MSELMLTEDVLGFLDDYISLYINDGPRLSEVNKFLRQKLLEKEIARSYQCSIDY